MGPDGGRGKTRTRSSVRATLETLLPSPSVSLPHATVQRRCRSCLRKSFKPLLSPTRITSSSMARSATGSIPRSRVLTLRGPCCHLCLNPSTRPTKTLKFFSGPTRLVQVVPKYLLFDHSTALWRHKFESLNICLAKEQVDSSAARSLGSSMLVILRSRSGSVARTSRSPMVGGSLFDCHFGCHWHECGRWFIKAQLPRVNCQYTIIIEYLNIVPL